MENNQVISEALQQEITNLRFFLCPLRTKGHYRFLKDLSLHLTPVIQLNVLLVHFYRAKVIDE